MDDDQPVDDVVQEEVVQPDPEPVQAEADPVQDPEPEPVQEPEPEPVQEPEPEPEPQPVPQEEEKVEEAIVEAPAYNGDLPASISDACDILYSDNPAYNWMVTNLADAKKGKDGLVMESVGTGGLNELKEFVKDKKSNIMFFLLRVNTYDDEGSSRAKFIYGRFMGTGVKFMQKAKLTPQLGAIADEFQVKHLSRDADEGMKDWDPETLGKEFLRIGGAHKPSKYDFGPNAVYNCK